MRDKAPGAPQLAGDFFNFDAEIPAGR